MGLLTNSFRPTLTVQQGKLDIRPRNTGGGNPGNWDSVESHALFVGIRRFQLKRVHRVGDGTNQNSGRSLSIEPRLRFLDSALTHPLFAAETTTRPEAFAGGPHGLKNGNERGIVMSETAAPARDLRWRDLIEGLGVIVWELDPASLQFTSVSGAAEEILGYPVRRWLDEPNFLPSIMHPEDRDSALELRKVIKEGGHRRFDFRVIDCRGEIVWLRASVSPQSGVAGIRGRAAGVMVDVTDRSNQAASLARLTRQSELMLQAAGEGICGLDAADRVTFINPSGARMLGWSTGDILGRSHHELAHHSRTDDTPYPLEECPIFQSLRGGTQHSSGEDVFWRKDGSCFPVSYTSTPIEEDGVLVGAVVTFRDVTETTTLEEQLRQSQKMDAVGQLAGGIAHDLNNLLTAILGNCELMFEDLLTDEAKTAAKEIELTAEMAATLVDQLLQFSRRRVREMQVFDLADVIGSIKPMLRRVIREDIAFEASLNSGDARVKADRGQIEQVILNLTINASDAMPEGGSVVIETASVDSSTASEGSRARHPLTRGEYVLLKVSDTGIGMDDATKQRIFEPFFTTKNREPGRGTGLGLATVYAIVSQSNGRIFVETEPGGGTAFYVYLPRDKSATNGDAVVAPQEVAGSSVETVLLVEDDHMVRSVALRILSRRGYEVLEAANGSEALALSSSYSKPIHLLLTDVVMPEMSGSILAEKIVQERPSTSVLFISGYTEDALAPGGLLKANMDFLAKPFHPADLTAKVREVLDRRARARS